jgi:hypothetical protein
LLDEYDQEEIIEYFKGCETSSLQVALEELSEHNFSWEQLKLMRIKFLDSMEINNRHKKPAISGFSLGFLRFKKLKELIKLR